MGIDDQMDEDHDREIDQQRQPERVADDLRRRACRYSKDQPQSPWSKPENPFGPGMTPIQTRYCSQTGRSSPYCLMRNSAFATDADSPCARNSAIWLDRKSPGRQLDDEENECRDDQQVTPW